MAFSERSLDDYVDVAQRIADFREQYPSGSLQPADLTMPYHVVRVPAGWCQQCIGRRQVKSGQSWKTCPRCSGSGVRAEGEPTEDIFIVYAAAAYREPGDPRPGIGMAWEPFPGRTPYTAASELMNAETSAWGRAIQAVLASDAKKGVASREEVRNRRAEREDGLPTNADGSLSRSRTTDMEKDAAGVMTTAQLAEHTALQPKRTEQTGRVTRVRPDPTAGGAGSLPGMGSSTAPPATSLSPTGGADPWLDQPAAPLEGVEDQPGSIDPADQRAIMAAVGKMERGERLAKFAAILGHPVASTNELSFQEGRRVRDKLKGAAT
jgi:hypothetical protein